MKKDPQDWPPAGPASVPWEKRKICQICGGRYVPGYYRLHVDMMHFPAKMIRPRP